MKFTPLIAPQKNCFLVSCAMVLGCKIEELESEIGHDGLQKVPNYGIRGIHPQEVLDSFLIRGYVPLYVEINPHVSFVESGMRMEVFNVTKQVNRFMKLIDYKRAVIGGKLNKANHAVAWDGEQVHDPGGRNLRLDDLWIKDALVLCES